MELAHSQAGCKRGDDKSLEVDIEKLLSIQDDFQNDGGLTTAEWAEELGMGIKKVRQIIGTAVGLGLVKAGARYDANHWSGRTVRYQVFEVIK